MIRRRELCNLKDQVDREITDDEMIVLAARGGSFDFLNDERENIYTESDGTPL